MGPFESAVNASYFSQDLHPEEAAVLRAATKFEEYDELLQAFVNAGGDDGHYSFCNVLDRLGNWYDYFLARPTMGYLTRIGGNDTWNRNCLYKTTEKGREALRSYEENYES